MNIKNPWLTNKELPNDLYRAKELLFDKNNFDCSQPILEPESKEYGACSFILNGLSVRFRVGKITPTKIGHFVTLWKRINNGPIQPFDSADAIELFVISTQKDNRIGHFVFPMSALVEKAIVSSTSTEGRRAIRVYPPWDLTMSKQAQKTQLWQLEYFIEFFEQDPINLDLANKLYFK